MSMIRPNPSFPKGRLHPPYPLQGEWLQLFSFTEIYDRQK